MYTFDCGCSFPTDESGNIILDIGKVRLDCPAVYDMLGRGLTKGVFQLESKLGRQWCTKLKPENIEHLAALGAILRPGCISCDTNIRINLLNRRSRNVCSKLIKISDLYNQFIRNHCNYTKSIVSLHEQSSLLFNNTIDNVIYTGKKDVYKPYFKFRTRDYFVDRKYSNLECTLDHMLLTNRGWVELQNINIGDRVAITNNRRYNAKTKVNFEKEKGFRDICYYNYEYHCIFCDWKEASLDVNHIEGNRTVNNHPDNLCFLCPNHHRMYTEGKINKEQIIFAREKYKLQSSQHIQWCEYLGKDYVGIKDTYDIKVNGPNHNFIAGNVVVHNCLRAVDENNISATEHYCRRKNGEEPVVVFHESIKHIVEQTYGIQIYQEQAMQIAQVVAGLTLQEADELRKAIGKKIPALMAEVKVKFMAGAKKMGVVTDSEAIQLFEWIEKSQRYSFNKSHAVSYGINGYYSAYCKAHFPLSFFTSYLYFSQEKQKPQQEVYELINEAKLMNIEVQTPNILNGEQHFYTDGKIITFGLTDIQGIGDAAYKRLITLIKEQEKIYNSPIKDWSWFQVLVRLVNMGASTLTALIGVGAFRHFGSNRTKMLAELKVICSLTKGELAWLVANHNYFTSVYEALRTAANTKKNGGACHTEEKVRVLRSELEMLEHPATKLEDSPNWIAGTEEALLGIAVTCSRIDSCDVSAINTTCKEVFQNNSFKGTNILGVEIQDVQELKTKRGKNPGQKMAKLVITDGSYSIEAICWPDTYKEIKHLLVRGNMVIIQGEKEQKQGSFVMKKVWQAHALDNSV